MKKAIYLLMMCAGTVLFTSCEKDEIGGTATEALAGEWMLTVDAVDDAGNVIAADYAMGTKLGITYNTVDNVPDKMYVSDLGNLWKPYTVVVNCDCTALTFSTDGYVQNEADDNQVMIEDGKMLPGAATTPSGMPADSLVYYISFNDEDLSDYGIAKYKVAGYRRTGFVADNP